MLPLRVQVWAQATGHVARASRALAGKARARWLAEVSGRAVARACSDARRRLRRIGCGTAPRSCSPPVRLAPAAACSSSTRTSFRRTSLARVGHVFLFADQQCRVAIGELVDQPGATRAPLELTDAQDADGSAARVGDRECGVALAREVLLCLFEGPFRRNADHGLRYQLSA